MRTEMDAAPLVALRALLHCCHEPCSVVSAAENFVDWAVVSAQQEACCAAASQDGMDTQAAGTGHIHLADNTAVAERC
jgi:hypothetical protein